MLVNLFKKIEGKMELVDFGYSTFSESYEKQGYVVQPRTNKSHISKKADDNKFIIHHIHRVQFNLRSRINNLICKLIPERFLNY
jgi:hypothetical protein